VKWLTAILLVALLAACTSTGDRAVNPLAQPPWEAFVAAGYGAEFEVDLETLNGPGADTQIAQSQDPSLRPGLDEPAPEAPEAEVAAKAEQPAASKAKHNPDATAINAVAVPPVTGGDQRANAELTQAMRDVLREAGWPVIDAPRKDALTIEGKLSVAPEQASTQKVGIAWLVKTPKGSLLGDLKQSNDVPAGALTQGLGENARYAAEAAADGIFKLIQKYR
jgi:hypothetical protein